MKAGARGVGAPANSRAMGLLLLCANACSAQDPSPTARAVAERNGAAALPGGLGTVDVRLQGGGTARAGGSDRARILSAAGTWSVVRHSLATSSGSRPPLARAVADASVTVPELIALMRDKKLLRGLTPDMGIAPQSFAALRRLARAFEQTVHDEAVWEFEGENADGFVRGVTVAFHPTTTGWRFHALQVRVHSDDPAATFAEIRRSAIAVLRKPRWTDLGAQGPTGWSLGEGWEFVVGPGGRGELRLRSGLAPRR